MQAFGPDLAQAGCAQGRRDASGKQRLGSIDIADPDHDVTGQQHLLDRGATRLQRLPERERLETRPERLDTQMPKQLAL